MSARNRTNALALNAAGVTTALAFLAQEAEAAVLYFTPETSPFSSSLASFNPTTTDIKEDYGNPNLIKPYSCTPCFMEYSTSTANGLEGLVQNSGTALDAGVTLTTSDVATGGTKYVQVPFDGSTFYLGFAFRASGSSDAYNLGWVELSYSSFTANITQWAYETIPGQSIETGAAVPEPATTAMITGVVTLGGCLAARYFKLKRRA